MRTEGEAVVGGIEKTLFTPPSSSFPPFFHDIGQHHLCQNNAKKLFFNTNPRVRLTLDLEYGPKGKASIMNHPKRFILGKTHYQTSISMENRSRFLKS